MVVWTTYSLLRIACYSRQSLVNIVESKHKEGWGKCESFKYSDHCRLQRFSQKRQISQICVLACVVPTYCSFAMAASPSCYVKAYILMGIHDFVSTQMVC